MLGSCSVLSTTREQIKNNLGLVWIKSHITFPFYRWLILERIEELSIFLPWFK
jgi:hypothetical protein